MTPEQKIKVTILMRAVDDGEFVLPCELDSENVDDWYDEAKSKGIVGDYLCDFRGGEVETDLPCDYSRHYESNSVAAQMFDGSWVGWTYWYGGGKHGEPEAIDWMSDAYFLDCVEEEKLVIIRTFTKVSQ